MDPNQINEESPVEDYIGDKSVLDKRMKERKEIKISLQIEMEFDKIQLELLKQIKAILREPKLDYEKLGALVDTYEVLLSEVEE